MLQIYKIFERPYQFNLVTNIPLVTTSVSPLVFNCRRAYFLTNNKEELIKRDKLGTHSQGTGKFHYLTFVIRFILFG